MLRMYAAMFPAKSSSVLSLHDKGNHKLTPSAEPHRQLHRFLFCQTNLICTVHFGNMILFKISYTFIIRL